MGPVWFIVLGYLSGSILFAYYLPLWWKGIDITEGTPDGNPGTFNCIAKAGKSIGLLALCLDLLKGAAPVFWAARVLNMGHWTFALVIAAPVVGHAFSLFRRFRGGKAIAVTFGVTIGLWPLWQPFALLVACYLFFTLVVQVEPHRIRSILTFVCFGLGGLLWSRGTTIALGCLLAAGIVIWRHWAPNEQEEKAAVRLLPALRGR